MRHFEHAYYTLLPLDILYEPSYTFDSGVGYSQYGMNDFPMRRSSASVFCLITGETPNPRS